MDVISNMLITIKNGAKVNKERVLVPHSLFKQSIAKALLDAGYIESYSVSKRDKGQDQLDIVLKYDKVSKRSRITDVKRLSKPSRRLYISAKNISKVKDGFGALFVSTPKGVMTGKEAYKSVVGGEVLFEIW